MIKDQVTKFEYALPKLYLALEIILGLELPEVLNYLNLTSNCLTVTLNLINFMMVMKIGAEIQFFPLAPKMWFKLLTILSVFNAGFSERQVSNQFFSEEWRFLIGNALEEVTKTLRVSLIVLLFISLAIQITVLFTLFCAKGKHSFHFPYFNLTVKVALKKSDDYRSRAT